MKKSTLILLLFVFVQAASNGQTFTVTGASSAQQLVTNLIGPGILTTNVSGQISNLSAGIFSSNGVQGFTLGSGIILSTGLINNMLGTAAYHNSTDLGMPNSTLLDAVVSPALTQDAQIISFDFQCASDSVEFNFVFSSEEYNDYVNTSFNDVFGFFVNGPGFAPNTNVALIPGTTTPVSINTVNNGNSGGTATGPCLNCAYYVDNVNTNAVGLSMDGYTVVMKVKFPVWPCSPYHFDIAIADVADGVFDSAVMLESNSFVACPNMTAFQNGQPVGSNVSICAGGSVTLTAPPGANYFWSNGDTTQSIIVTQPGQYNFGINAGLCFSYSQNITVTLAGNIPTPVISQMVTNFVSNVTGAGITYQWSLDGNAIPGATQPSVPVMGNGCYSLTIYQGSCEAISNVICITNTSIHEISNQEFIIYPHPVIGTSSVKTPFTSGITTLKLYDLSGRLLFTKDYEGNEPLYIEKSTLNSGLYLLEISNSQYQGTIMKKMVIR